MYQSTICCIFLNNGCYDLRSIYFNVYYNVYFRIRDIFFLSVEILSSLKKKICKWDYVVVLITLFVMLSTKPMWSVVSFPLSSVSGLFTWNIYWFTVGKVFQKAVRIGGCSCLNASITMPTQHGTFIVWSR